MSSNLDIKKIEKVFTEEQFLFFKDIIKNENPDSILASLDQKLLYDYFKILINSKNLFLYYCIYKDQNIGYVILSKKPAYLINDFKSLKYKIFLTLIFNFRIKALINIILSLLKLDLFFLSNKQKIFIQDNLNLNLLAISKNFQSKGLGKEFVIKVLKNVCEDNEFKKVTLETNDYNAERFYINKLNFVYLAKKIRLFKNFKILYKNLD